MRREYSSITESSKIIAGEVVEFGTSSNWVGGTDVSIQLEKHLSKFNIGYTDPKNGSWAHRKGGTRYFNTLNMMNVAKHKFNSLVSSIKNR